MLRSTCLTIALLGTNVATCAAEFSTGVGDGHPRRVFWGDTHLHTALSTDAFGFGVRLGPDDALRFASGQEVRSSHGLAARLTRALDFVVLADHAESIGLMVRVRDGDPELMKDPRAAGWHQQMTGDGEGLAAIKQMMLESRSRYMASRHLGELATPALRQSIWDEVIDTVERHNHPGVFTTLFGFEWSLAPGGDNLHRVVVFRDGPERVRRVLPLSSVQADAPELLWRYLAAYETSTGGRVLAIPHNGNTSNGAMFPDRKSLGGVKIDADWSATRARWEPVYETTQMKGDGESHPLLSPDDEFAGYETWDLGNMRGARKKPGMLQFEYSRSALKTGLAIEARTGVNPYHFGLIGSTDSHTGLGTADDNNFFGKHSGVEPAAQRWNTPVGEGGGITVYGWQMAASGYAAAWASENTREALWDAFARREVYASTGPRITLRFFGGFDLPSNAATQPDVAAIGYAHGVPMGGELQGSGRAPRFLVAARRDPEGANLDRVQIVKGWIDGRGATHERVFDVAWSDPGARRRGPDGRLPPVGSTVDVAEASYTNTIGAAELATVWEDPGFDATQNAFWYVRVLQIPTPRWTAYDAKRLGVTMDPAVPMVTQERAYSSPGWYRPPG